MMNNPMVPTRYITLRIIGRILCFLPVLVLAACSNSEDMIAMQTYVNTVVNRPPGPIEPPPEFINYESFTYSAASMRAPFDPPIDLSIAMQNQQNNLVRPDENRPREELENFAIGNLLMVGTLSREGQNWALVRDETNRVTRVTVGHYLGRNHGRIVAVSDTQIDVVEIVPTGDSGWIERPQTLLLQQR
jgi:type IV pilus assembly protein PilP